MNNDPYLVAQVDLQNDLIAVGSELNPIKKFEKLKKLVEGVKIANKLKKIIINKSGLEHIYDRHTIDGINSSGKSIFKNKSEIEKLIKDSESITPKTQNGGNYERVVKYNKSIGIDRGSGKETNIYTVITDKDGNLITAFPGNP